MVKQRILVIEDDIDLCRLLKDSLEQEGYEVFLCYDGISGWKEIKQREYQLVVLDIMLPYKNGYEVLQEIRKESIVPVLMLTAKDSEGDRVSGLRMGADDYLTKPFYNSEFLARVSSLLRRYMVFNDSGDRIGNKDSIIIEKLRIYERRREVFKGETELDLTAKEFDLLWFLAKNRGQVFTKKQIYRAVWKEEYAFDDNNIMVHIRRLRKKLEDDPEHPFYILTVWGVGYKFRDKREER